MHAAKKWSREQRDLLDEEPFRSCLKDHVSGNILEPLPLGRIVGVVNLTAVVPVDRIVTTDEDRAFGDFSKGRYGWFARDAWRLPTPIELRGQQGMWTLPDEQYQYCRRNAKQTRASTIQKTRTLTTSAEQK